MPLKVYKRGKTYHYTGTVAGRRLRGTTGATDKLRAEEVAAQVEESEWKRRHHGPVAVLTFAKASILYRSAGKMSTKRQVKYLEKIEDYWKDTLVKDMTAGAIRQSAIDIYPKAAAATRNRQVITPTRAVINHCAELEMCPPIRVRKFRFEQRIKKPILLDWLDTFTKHARPIMSALATFMFATACRISEARRIEWSDIDFNNRTILVRKTKNKKQRLAHMPERLLIALANLPRDKRPFWPGETTLRRWWDDDITAIAEANGEAGFEHMTFHSCRHGFATKMLRDGVDPKTAAQLGGWDSVTLFIDTYAHAMQDRQLTENLFGTNLTQPKRQRSKNKRIDR